MNVRLGLLLLVFLFGTRTIDTEIASAQEVIEHRRVLLVLHETLYKLVLTTVKLLCLHTGLLHLFIIQGRCSNTPRTVNEAARNYLCQDWTLLLFSTSFNHGRVQLGQITAFFRFDASLASLQAPLHLIELLLGNSRLILRRLFRVHIDQASFMIGLLWTYDLAYKHMLAIHRSY